MKPKQRKTIIAQVGDPWAHEPRSWGRIGESEIVFYDAARTKLAARIGPRAVETTTSYIGRVSLKLQHDVIDDDGGLSYCKGYAPRVEYRLDNRHAHDLARRLVRIFDGADTRDGILAKLRSSEAVEMNPTFIGSGVYLLQPADAKACELAKHILDSVGA